MNLRVFYLTRRGLSDGYIASGEACAHDKRTKCEKERPERAVSS